jgi:hypothetical protein
VAVFDSGAGDGTGKRCLTNGVVRRRRRIINTTTRFA